MSENEMLCKTCRRWVDGWCLAQQMGTPSDKVCNAWELSLVVDWVSEKDALNKRIVELEAFIGQLIKAGDAMSNAQSMWVVEEDKWDALVKDWKERER